MGEVEKLRQAREAMNEIFPLTPAMWQEWVRDEASLSAGYIYFFLFFFALYLFSWEDMYT